MFTCFAEENFHMNGTLETLRVQNEALLFQLRQGQHLCHQILKSAEDRKCLNGRLRPLPESIESRLIDRNETRSNVEISETSPEKSRTVRNLMAKKFFVRCTEQSRNQIDSGLTQLAESKNRNVDSLASRNKNTPKSILKSRKIVDDNVKVDSKFVHTPTYNALSRSEHLNFSYSEDGDLEIAKNTFLREQKETDNQDTKAEESDRSYISWNLAGNAGQKSTNRNGFLENEDVEASRKDQLLLDAGNDRKNVAVVESLKHRPKSLLCDSETSDSSSTQVSVLLAVDKCCFHHLPSRPHGQNPPSHTHTLLEHG